LAGPVGAEEGHDGPLGDLDAHPPEHEDHLVVDDLHVPRPQDRLSDSAIMTSGRAARARRFRTLGAAGVFSTSVIPAAASGPAVSVAASAARGASAAMVTVAMVTHTLVVVALVVGRRGVDGCRRRC